MDTTIDKIENLEALIKIRVKEDDYQPRVSQKIKEFSKKANIKGFRPGKVPPGLVKSMYGQSFVVEEVNTLISEELNRLLKESELQFLGEPLSHDSQPEIHWETQRDFEFVFNIGYADPFEVNLSKKIKVDYHKIKVDDAVIDETIGNLCKQFGEVSNPEAVSKGDEIHGTVKSKDDAIDKDVVIDLTQMKDATAKKLVGMKVDDAIEINVATAFAEKEYFLHISGLTEDQLKSVKNKLTLTITGISHIEPVAINQELFDRTFGPDQVKSEEEFREKIKDTISRNYEMEAEKFFHHKLKERLVEKTKINLPDSFLKRWLIQSNDDVTEEVIDQEYEQYAKELKWSLIRSKVSKDQELSVSYEEVKEEAKKLIIRQFGGQPSIVAQLKDQLDGMAENYLQGENGSGENYMKVYNEIMNKKVFEYAAGTVSVKEKMISLDDFRKL